jgi:hypothetical protein
MMRNAGYILMVKGAGKKHFEKRRRILEDSTENG